jgi:hypothetical protein
MQFAPSQRRDRSAEAGVAAYHARVWMATDKLAWRLADALPSLPDGERHDIFIALGCGEYRRAITASLRAMVHTEAALPEALTRDVGVWVHAFGDDGDREYFGHLLDASRGRRIPRPMPDGPPSAEAAKPRAHATPRPRT